MTGSAQYMDDEQRESAAFPSKSRTIIGATLHDFNDPKFSRSSDPVVVEHFAYTARLNPDYPSTVAGFVTESGKASYASASTRPDQACTLYKASQVRADEADEQAHEDLASALRNLNSPIALRCPRLDLSTAEVRVYADASWANNRDLSSQLGYLVYLVDASGKSLLLHWQSKKSRRVTRSTMAAEVFDPSNGFDAGFAIRDLVAARPSR